MFCTKTKILEIFIYVMLVSSLTQILISSWHKFDERRWKQNPMILYWPHADNNIECYSYLTNDALPSVEDRSFSPKSNSIFFHETSCRGGIDSRQACAVESAAKAHPDWEVYLLFNGPVTYDMLKKGCIVKLFQYPNIRVARIHADIFSKNTIVHSIVTQELLKSKHPVEHSADIMRMLTLNKWGGVYLDLDMLVIKSFNSLPENWIAKESSFDLASGVMRFSNDEIGQNITTEVLREINRTYDSVAWSENGPKAIERVLLRRCKDVISKQGPAYNGDCKGVKIFNYELFYPIKFSDAHLLVKPRPLAAEKNKPYTYHMWNLLTKIYTINPNSPYAKTAAKVCPLIYETHGDAFGV